VRIQFDVPADPAYAARVAHVLSEVYLRKYRYIGFGLVAVGLIGLALPLPHSDSGNGATPIFTTIIVVGVLSLLFPFWVRYSARRRSGGLAVEGSYEITDDNVMMRSGTESGGIAWEGVTKVTEAPGFWLLYVGRVPYTVIPHEFMSEEEQRTLREFLVELGSLPAAQD
jgi:hypothetical protein